MNKKIYSLIALGALLLVAACSDNASPVSGSTSIPNMGNNLNVPQSPVLCSVMGVTDSLEALEKGCIWSPEMWGPTTGYRVRTGYDNGTNTSGIWTVSTYPENAYVDMIWPGNATTEYDSMALADVIDKCGGSLCGKVVYELNGNKPDSAAENEFDRRASVEFYFAGKDSLGNIKEIDARAMHGICVEYAGDISVELIPSDSIASLNEISTFGFSLPYSWKPNDLQSKIKKVCNIWGGFGFYASDDQDAAKIGLVPMEDVLAHLKGLRFKFHYNEENTEFNITSIDWYNLTNVPMTDSHPYEEKCEPLYVDLGYCDCEFTTEDLAVASALISSVSHFAQKKIEVESDSIPLSNLSKECLKSTLDSLSFLQRIKQTAPGSAPCDNPRPLSFACADGTSSVSTEFYEKYMEYENKIQKPLEEKMIAAVDSLFTHCMSFNE